MAGYLGNAPTAVPLTSADITDGIITSAKIADGTIVNADINASAGVALTKLASTGTLTVDNIQFPATAVDSANANNLDDYEEGTWTPVVSGSISGSGTPTASPLGKYTKIGNLVYVNIYIANSTFPTFAGELKISLPFTPLSGSHSYFGDECYFYPNGNWETLTNFVTIYLKADGGVPTARVAIYETNGDRQNVLYQGTNCNLSAQSGLYFQTSMHYIV